MPQPKVFQSFQPIGGVRARLLVRAGDDKAVRRTTAQSKQRPWSRIRIWSPAFSRNDAVGAPFPLTPALSLRERENVSQANPRSPVRMTSDIFDLPTSK